MEGAVVVFQGQVLPIAAMLEAARTTPETPPSTRVGVRNTAALNAEACQTLLAQGETPDGCWRFGILQTLDDYTSVLRRGGPDLAAGVFTDAPPRTGSAQLDAAFAALADCLADRDGWTAPNWVSAPSRRTEAWYPAVPVIFRAEADQESPDAFRRRGILITARSLARA